MSCPQPAACPWPLSGRCNQRTTCRGESQPQPLDPHPSPTSTQSLNYLTLAMSIWSPSYPWLPTKLPLMLLPTLQRPLGPLWTPKILNGWFWTPGFCGLEMGWESTAYYPALDDDHLCISPPHSQRLTVPSCGCLLTGRGTRPFDGSCSFIS